VRLVLSQDLYFCGPFLNASNFAASISFSLFSFLASLNRFGIVSVPLVISIYWHYWFLAFHLQFHFIVAVIFGHAMFSVTFSVTFEVTEILILFFSLTFFFILLKK